MPRKTVSTIALGVGGLKQYGGRVDEEFHPKLRGGKAAKIYEEMRENDAVIGAVLYTIEAFLRKVKWSVKGPDKKEADFLQSCMEDMDAPWDDFISDALSFLTYGYSLHEIVYKIRLGPEETNPRYYSKEADGRLGWRALALRPQSTIDRWDIDDVTGEVKGAFQQPPTGLTAQELYLPMSRCVLLRTRPYKGSPEGRSVLRSAYRSWYFKKRLEEIEAIGINRDLSGLPVIHVPPQIMSPNATAAQVAIRQHMEKLVSQLHRDEREGVVFPSEFQPGEPQISTGYKLGLLSSPGGKQVPADPVIRRYDSRIAMTMCAEFILLGTEKQGSFALGADKSANFLRSLSWYVETIAATLNKTAVRRLYDVNNVPVEKRAQIVAGDIDMPGLAEFGLFLQQVTASGLLHPTPAVENKIRELARLPTDDDVEGLFADEKAAAEAAAAALQMQPPPGQAPNPTEVEDETGSDSNDS